VNVTTEPRDNRQMALTIEVEPERVEKALAQAARRLAQKYKVPGFRPGKAPRAVVERMLGKQALYEEVVDDLGPVVYKEALEQHNIDPFGPGEMEDFTVEPMVFKMLVPLAPIVDLGDYRSIRLPHIEPNVDEHDIEHQLEHMRENQAIVEPVGDDVPAEVNMIAKVDIEGTVEGREFITKQNGVTINLYEPLDREEDLLDFSAPIIGLKPGEDKAFALVVPDSDRYGEFRGKTADFTVHLIELQKRELPALDDALAQTVGDYETLDALKDVIRAELRTNLIREADSKYSDQAIDAMVKGATIEYPPQMLTSEVDALVERTEKRMKDQNMTLEEYLKALGKTADEYREELKPTAAIRLRRGLVLNQLIKEEGLSVADEDVVQRIIQMAEIYGERAAEARKAFMADANRQSIMLDLLSSAGLARAVAIAKGQAPDKVEAAPAAVEPAADSATSEPVSADSADATASAA
jgi:trigger factor